MFKRQNRLVPGIKFSNSRIFTIPQFILKEKANDLGVNRFGIVVSKKIDKKAIVRNSVKRFFRTVLMNLEKHMNVGHDILVIVKKEINNKPEGENLLSIKKTLGKAGLLRIND